MSLSEFPSHGLFVTGTDTGVGKTLVTVALIEALKREGFRVAGMKPVAAGLDYAGKNEDVIRLMKAANISASIEEVCPYRLEPAIAPHVAAGRCGVRMDLATIGHAYDQLAARADWVVVEGAGGFLVPMDDDSLGMDAIPVRLSLSVVLVVGMRLGCLNHALLTAEAIRARGLVLAGWVANCIDPDMMVFEENVQTLMHRLNAPCFGVIPWFGNCSDPFSMVENEIRLPVVELVNTNTLK